MTRSKYLENIFSSLHTHTIFCDGGDDIETMCRAAHAKGLAAIGFSSHAPIGRTGIVTHWHMKDEMLGKYADEVHAARRRWEGRLAVYLGLEVDYIKGLRSALDSDIRNLGLDYTIGSVHYLLPPRGAPFTVDGSAEELEQGITEGFSGDGEAMMNAYWDALAEMTALGGLDIIGHLDLVKKNNAGGIHKYRWFDMDGSAYAGRVDEIVRAVSSGGFAAEVNTGGFNRGLIADTYPSLPVLRLLCQHKVPVLISADAHRAEDLDGHYDFARKNLLDAGYTHHVLFERRSGGKPVWSEQRLQA